MPLLRDRKLAVIADVENLSYSSRNAGYKLSYAALASVLQNTAESVDLHACFSREPDLCNWEQYFRLRGWTPYARDIQYIQTGHGFRKEANADALVAFQGGRLAGESDADILIATGDGGLATDIANSIVALWPDRMIFTLVFPGAASVRLRASNRSVLPSLWKILFPADWIFYQNDPLGYHCDTGDFCFVWRSWQVIGER